MLSSMSIKNSVAQRI